MQISDLMYSYWDHALLLSSALNEYKLLLKECNWSFALNVPRTMGRCHNVCDERRRSLHNYWYLKFSSQSNVPEAALVSVGNEHYN